MPSIEIRIETAVAAPPPMALSFNEGEMFDDGLEADDADHFHRPNFQLPSIRATIVLSHGLMAPSYPAIHTSDALQYFKPPHMLQQEYGRIEELDADSDEEHEEDPGNAHSSAAADPQAATVQNQESSTVATAKVSSSMGITETVKISQSVDLESEKPFSKSVKDMDVKEEQRYRHMLRERYPFGEQVSVQTQRAIRELGFCEQGFPWIRDLGRHKCGGGCHFAYDFDVRDHMYRHDM